MLASRLVVAHVALMSGLALGLAEAGARAQQAGGASPAQIATGNAGAVMVSTGVPERDTLLKLMRPIVVDFNETRLEDVFAFLQATTGADIAVYWTDNTGNGLDRDMLISYRSRGRTALDIIEAVIKKIDQSGQLTGGAQWQMAESGEIEIGPKERLNETTRLELYPVRDLLTEIPDFVDAPTFDLNSVLSGAQGGGGGQSPFQPQGTTSALSPRSEAEQAEDLISIIVRAIEPEQWEQNAGLAATIRYYQGSLLVTAPDYIHRQLGGYPYWPSATAASGEGAMIERRWVNMSTSVQFAEPLGFRSVPVTGVAGGGSSGGGTGPGGGGGGSSPPGGGG